MIALTIHSRSLADRLVARARARLDDFEAGFLTIFFALAAGAAVLITAWLAVSAYIALVVGLPAIAHGLCLIAAVALWVGIGLGVIAVLIVTLWPLPVRR